MLELAPLLALVFLLLLAMGVWVGFSLMLTAVIALLVNQNNALELIIASSIFSHLSSWSLTALPLFILMGELLFRANLAEDLFEGLTPFVNKVPGKLIHVNVIGSGLFAAISGSSAATAATIGRMTYAELTQRGYNKQLIIGSLAGSATLGLLIPPSIVLIVYAVAADVSISDLFMAAIIPGLLLLVLFSCYTCFFTAPDELSQKPRIKKRHALLKLAPVLILLTMVLGSLYSGLAAPSESAALGVIGALLLLAFKSKLTIALCKDALLATVTTSSMILLIIAGASCVTIAAAFLQLPGELTAWVAEHAPTPMMLLVSLTLLFIVLGLFLDGISIVVLTGAILLPIVEAAGFDLIWFGIYLVVVVEMSQITPPVGFNLFVLRALSKESIYAVAKASLPFFMLMGLMLVILALFPILTHILL